MNSWLWASFVLIALTVLLVGVAAIRPPIEGLVALELAGVNTTLAMVLLSQGTHSQSFVDLAIVLAVLSFAGAIVFVRFIHRAL